MFDFALLRKLSSTQIFTVFQSALFHSLGLMFADERIFSSFTKFNKTVHAIIIYEKRSERYLESQAIKFNIQTPLKS
jgi:hypothetical protein